MASMSLPRPHALPLVFGAANPTAMPSTSTQWQGARTHQRPRGKRMAMPGWRRLCAPIPPPKRCPFAVSYSSGSPPPINPRMCRWPPSWPASVIQSGGGVSAILRTASPVCTMRRARVVRGAFSPSERVDVLSIAPKKPATYHSPATRWSLDDLVAALPQHRLRPMRRSRVAAPGGGRPHAPSECVLAA